MTWGVRHMNLLLLPFAGRYLTLTAAVVATVVFTLLSIGHLAFLIPAAVTAAVSLIGIHDVVQTRHSILRNYPITAHIRFFLESFRPEIRQYFLEDDHDGAPFPRKKRSIVYQRAKGQ